MVQIEGGLAVMHDQIKIRSSPHPPRETQNSPSGSRREITWEGNVDKEWSLSFNLALKI